MSNNFEPLKEGWLHPMLTARHMIDHASRKYLIFMITITALASVIVNLEGTDFYPRLPVWLLLILSVVFSPLVGIISIGFSAFMTCLFGKIVSGTATFNEMFRAISVASLPLFGALPFALAWMIFEPQSFYTSSDSFVEVTGIGSAAGIAMMVFSIWCFANTVGVIAEAHRFSIGKALFTMLIQVLFFIVVIVGLLIVFI